MVSKMSPTYRCTLIGLKEKEARDVSYIEEEGITYLNLLYTTNDTYAPAGLRRCSQSSQAAPFSSSQADGADIKVRHHPPVYSHGPDLT